MSAEPRLCQNCKKDFTIEFEDFIFYEKIFVPPPTFCPECRKQRRLSWRNDLNLYSRTCDLCKKTIISLYAPNSGMTIYCQKCWWSDKWNPKDYAQEYDSSKSFFEQFIALQHRVPALAMVNDNGIGSVNSEYTQDFAFGKNCYMVFIAWKIEDCQYGFYLKNGKNDLDFLYSMGDCQYTYETVQTEKCYQCKYVYYSSELSDCAFVYDCRDCLNCFMCVGLRHKKYCFKNEQYTKEEYEKILADYRLDTASGVGRAKKEFTSMLTIKPRRFANLRNCVNCTGDGLMHGKDSRFCFNVQRPEFCKWIENSDTPKDCYDLSVGGELNECYEGVTPDHSYHSRFAIFSWKNMNMDYVDGCHLSKYLFGCAGLRSAEHCILNKQYSKEEYEKLRAQIIFDMNERPYIDKKGAIYKYGEFFPTELSYFKYNESEAQDAFPLSKEEIEQKGWAWQDQLQMTKGKETLQPNQIPDAISDVGDSIVNEILACIFCGRNYKIDQTELDFYRKFKIPIPRECFFCRHQARLKIQNPATLVRRHCDCKGRAAKEERYKNESSHFHGDAPCPNEFETPFNEERQEIIYCEQCYNQEIA